MPVGRSGPEMAMVAGEASGDLLASLLLRGARPVSYTHLTLPTNREV